MDTPLLNIVMVTYNQENYVSQAIESVLMQITYFNYVLIISDDYSTDRTGIICQHYQKMYPDRIVLLTGDRNLGMATNYWRAFSNCTAKYIAILEGDDYYIDPRKLQEQVSILESNSEYGIVHSNYELLYEDGKKKIGHGFKQLKTLQGDLFRSLIKQNSICPATSCFRRQLFADHVDFNYAVLNSLQTIDIFLWLALTYHSRVYYQNRITACYRVLSRSISNNQDIERYEVFMNSSVAILKHYSDKYSDEKKVFECSINQIYTKFIFRLIEAKEYNKALLYARHLDLTEYKSRWANILAHNRDLRPVYRIYRGVILMFSSIKQAALKSIYIGKLH